MTVTFWTKFFAKFIADFFVKQLVGWKDLPEPFTVQTFYKPILPVPAHGIFLSMNYVSEVTHLLEEW